jgi:hypothetical protein
LQYNYTFYNIILQKERKIKKDAIRNNIIYNGYTKGLQMNNLAKENPLTTILGHGKIS